jgi:hypothetical protein
MSNDSPVEADLPATGALEENCEIEITPEMTGAGIRALRSMNMWHEEEESACILIFEAMFRALREKKLGRL